MPNQVVSVTRLVRRLRGGAQAILVECTDGRLYVLKFANNLQGSQVLFNESMGTELYRACGLPTPEWRPIFVQSSFIDEHKECWLQTEAGTIRPTPGWSFASRFVGTPDTRLYDVLSGSELARVRNRDDFWLSWLIDVCADHADNRQALFVERADHTIDALFIDHGHLFGGPQHLLRPPARASRYLDSRVYSVPSMSTIRRIERVLTRVNADALYRLMDQLPPTWTMEQNRESMKICIQRLKEPVFWRRVLSELIKTSEVSCGVNSFASHLEDVTHSAALCA